MLNAARRIVALAAIVFFGVVAAGNCSCTYTPYSPPPSAFAGSSDACAQTAIVPAIDTPMPKGKNVIWCGSFQMAWDQLNAAMHNDLDLPDAPEFRRLNAGKINAADLPTDYYAAAGALDKGIVRKIQSDMAVRFPEVKLAFGEPGNSPDVILAYAYLRAKVKFNRPYFDREMGDDFTDSAGHKTRVSSFGMFTGGGHGGPNGDLADQIEVLYTKADKVHGFGMLEFALDLDKKSKPDQLILACVQPGESLAATWQNLQRNMAGAKANGTDPNFDEDDTLAVPNVNFQINHRFSELEKAGGGKILKTYQSVNFLLDRSGASLTSEAFMFYTLGIARQFSFNRPFLIAMRKRGADKPYFLMWVDNAELLCKQAKAK